MSDVVEVDLGTGGGGGNLTALYLLKDHTNDTGLTAAIYLSDLSGSAGLLAVANDGTPSIDTSTYLTTASAAATYLTIAAAGSYLSGSLTSGRVPYASGAHALTDDANMTYASGTQSLSVTNIGGVGGFLSLYNDIGSPAASITLSSNVTLTGTQVNLQGIVHLASLTSNGFVTTSGATGLLGIDTSTYLTAASAAATYLTITTAASTYAPIGATYITQTPNGSLTAEQALSGLATGFVKNTTGTGVLSIDASTYLTTASAAASYQPQLSLTNKSVLFATGGSGVGQDNANFQYNSTTHILSVANITVTDTVIGSSTTAVFGKNAGETILTSGDASSAGITSIAGQTTGLNQYSVGADGRNARVFINTGNPVGDGNLIIGPGAGTASSVYGSQGAVIIEQAATAPTSAPGKDHVVLYVDGGTGSLKCRTNTLTTTIAA